MTVMHEPLDQPPPEVPARAPRVILRRLSLAAASAACIFFAVTLLLGARVSTAEHAAGAGDASEIEPAPATQQTDFSKFTHTNPQHARLPCLLCHQRADNSPRPVRSAGHTPCSGCHTQQFADASNPICPICHANPPSPAV